MSAHNKVINTELRLIVIGNSGTGKSSLVNRYVRNRFDPNYKATVVSEFGYKIFPYNGYNYRVQIWDLAGQEKYSALTKIFSKNAHGVYLVSDSQRRETLEEYKNLLIL